MKALEIGMGFTDLKILSFLGSRGSTLLATPSDEDFTLEIRTIRTVKKDNL